MTIKDLTDRLAEHEVFVSEAVVGTWERNEAQLYSKYIIPLAAALNCSVYDLFGIEPPETDIQEKRRMLLESIMIMPKDELEIIWNVSRIFNGNKHPLIHCVGMYISMSEDARAESVLALLETYRREKTFGRLVETAPNVDLEFALKEWGRLIK